MLKGPIYVAGHRGMAGSALVRRLRASGRDDLILKGHDELELLDQRAVRDFFEAARPATVFLAAARVGGIEANRSHPYEFLYENLQIQNNVIDSAFRCGTERFVFLGSSCIYPRECRQPMREEDLMTGPLEPTNEGYALAKIAAIRLLQALEREYGFASLSVMPCNLYGPDDSFDPLHSHVMAALVRRFVDAAERGDGSVTLWGTGGARREFLHVDDMAEAVMILLDRWPSAEIVNVGSGEDLSIAELARLVAEKAGFGGAIGWDSSRPDGMPRKCLDVSRLASFGFVPSVSLEAGIEEMIALYRARKNRQKESA
ncbi:MAG: GDP-L-fucose synthase [Synergistales bacterium]|nr:GDP-L-fucose synthase [Synergistales bacterium]